MDVTRESHAKAAFAAFFLNYSILYKMWCHLRRETGRYVPVPYSAAQSFLSLQRKTRLAEIIGEAHTREEGSIESFLVSRHTLGLSLALGRVRGL